MSSSSLQFLSKIQVLVRWPKINTSKISTQFIIIGTAAAISISIVLYHLSSVSSYKKKSITKDDDDEFDDVTPLSSKKDTKSTSTSTKEPTATTTRATTSTIDTDPTPRRDNLSSSTTTAATATTSSSSSSSTTSTIATEEKLFHAKIEELDKIGKAYFKEKKFLEAAQAFTEALECVSAHHGSTSMTDVMTLSSSASVDSATTTSTSLSNLLRQKVTLLNNRSAMYEKAEIYDLALEDCIQILEMEMTHTKARIRKLRIYEIQKQYHNALVEICAIQLLFMQTNRIKIQMNLPVPSPPIPQSKMEDVLNEILPTETQRYVTLLNERNARNKQQQLPGHYTILQLLRSYTEYNTWMALAAKDGNVDTITKKIDALLASSKTPSVIEQAKLYYQRGRRCIYDRKYEDGSDDFEKAYALLHNQPLLIASIPDDTYVRILEWTGMVRHWHYSLDDAFQCLQEASVLEPKNALLVVKQAGIQLDAGRQEDALQLFEKALQIDPNSVDALLHRSNLRIMLNQSDLAKTDLETCIKIRPSHTMARLRLASILVPMENMDGAKRQIDLAEQSEPNSSEVHSYRGELYFAQGEMELARQAFEKAIQLEPYNPTPYVNAAMAVINTPPSVPGQMPDTTAVVKLLEKAISVDPQFSPAYVHLGQLKLGTATNISAAREVVQLYDTALSKCRTPEEIKDLCGMRILAVAQVEAAEQLRMDTFNLN